MPRSMPTDRVEGVVVEVLRGVGDEVVVVGKDEEVVGEEALLLLFLLSVDMIELSGAVDLLVEDDV